MGKNRKWLCPYPSLWDAPRVYFSGFVALQVPSRMTAALVRRAVQHAPVGCPLPAYLTILTETQFSVKKIIRTEYERSNLCTWKLSSCGQRSEEHTSELQSL